MKTGISKIAHVILNCYTNEPGTYPLDYNEGTFKIFKNGNKTYVSMEPEDNNSSYSHENFKWGYLP